MCRSLERHRFLALLVPTLVGRLGAGVTLDVAPTAAMSDLVDRLVPRHLGMDVDPDADGRTVRCRASLTHVPLAASSVQLVLCSHVLEHIPDDRAAMRELTRVLSPSGVAVLAVPHRRRQPTDEDPTASPAERVRRFGQADHVRYYGADFVDRLVESGLQYDEVTPNALLSDAVVRTCGFMPGETFWLARPASPDGAAAEAVTGLLTGLADDMLRELLALMAATDASRTAELERTEDRRRRAVEYARRTRANYDRVAGRAPVRLAMVGWAALKRARQRTGWVAAAALPRSERGIDADMCRSAHGQTAGPS
jgi:SAM-dependent methyltransferase